MKPTNSDDVIDSKDILSYIKDKENDRDFELENFIKDFRDEHSDYDKELEDLED